MLLRFLLPGWIRFLMWFFTLACLFISFFPFVFYPCRYICVFIYQYMSVKRISNVCQNIDISRHTHEYHLFQLASTLSFSYLPSIILLSASNEPQVLFTRQKKTCHQAAYTSNNPVLKPCWHKECFEMTITLKHLSEHISISFREKGL